MPKLKTNVGSLKPLLEPNMLFHIDLQFIDEQIPELKVTLFPFITGPCEYIQERQHIKQMEILDIVIWNSELFVVANHLHILVQIEFAISNCVHFNIVTILYQGTTL